MTHADIGDAALDSEKSLGLESELFLISVSFLRWKPEFNFSTSVSIPVTLFSILLSANVIGDAGISRNCARISGVVRKAGLGSSASGLTPQLPGDIMPESKLAPGSSLRLRPNELRIPATRGKFPPCLSVIGRLPTLPLFGSQSGRRDQQKSHHRCNGLFSFSHTGHTHLSYNRPFT